MIKILPQTNGPGGGLPPNHHGDQQVVNGGGADACDSDSDGGSPPFLLREGPSGASVSVVSPNCTFLLTKNPKGVYIESFRVRSSSGWRGEGGGLRCGPRTWGHDPTYLEHGGGVWATARSPRVRSSAGLRGLQKWKSLIFRGINWVPEGS